MNDALYKLQVLKIQINFETGLYVHVDSTIIVKNYIILATTITTYMYMYYKTLFTKHTCTCIVESVLHGLLVECSVHVLS